MAQKNITGDLNVTGTIKKNGQSILGGGIIPSLYVIDLDSFAKNAYDISGTIPIMSSEQLSGLTNTTDFNSAFGSARTGTYLVYIKNGGTTSKYGQTFYTSDLKKVSVTVSDTTVTIGALSEAGIPNDNTLIMDTSRGNRRVLWRDTIQYDGATKSTDIVSQHNPFIKVTPEIPQSIKLYMHSMKIGNDEYVFITTYSSVVTYSTLEFVFKSDSFINGYTW